MKQEEGMEAVLRGAVEQALSHAKNVVILVEALVPLAIVKIFGACIPQAGGQLKVSPIEITVFSDDLLPISETIEAPTTTEPALLAEDKALEIANAYPLERHNISTMKATARFSVETFFMMSCKSLNEVKVLTMTKKKPYLFQVRSQKAFNKGELVLVPYGELIPKSPSLKVPYAEKDVHDVHLSILPFIVTAPPKPAPKAKATPKAASGSQPQTTDVGNEQPCPMMEFLLVSPAAMKSFDPDSNSISPFWAVSRLGRASKEESNMEILKYVLHVKYPEAGVKESVGIPKPQAVAVLLPKLFTTSAVLRNTKKVAIGDVLTLPYEADAEKAVQLDRP